VTVVALGAVRSAGVTTTAAGLATVWPGEQRRVLVEADPAGGTLAAAAGLAAEPGLVSLAAAARRQSDPQLVFSHAQALADGTPVVPAPPGAEQARSALAMLGLLFGRLGRMGELVLFDCGRLDPAAPPGVFDAADLAALVCRPQLGDLNALAALLSARPDTARTIVLVGGGPYPAGEIAETLGVEVLGQLPWDPEAAAALATTAPTSRRLTRTALVRALRSLAATMAARLTESAALPEDPSVGSLDEALAGITR